SAREKPVTASARRSSFFFGLGRFLPALQSLSSELLREPLDPPFRVDQLLPAGEEALAVGADFQVHLWLGRPRRQGRSARAPHFDLVVLGMNLWFHRGYS